MYHYDFELRYCADCSIYSRGCHLPRIAEYMGRSHRDAWHYDGCFQWTLSASPRHPAWRSQWTFRHICWIPMDSWNQFNEIRQCKDGDSEVGAAGALSRQLFLYEYSHPLNGQLFSKRCCCISWIINALG